MCHPGECVTQTQSDSLSLSDTVRVGEGQGPCERETLGISSVNLSPVSLDGLLESESVSCRLCGQGHKLKVDVNGRPCVNCRNWKQNLSFKADGADYLMENLPVEVGDRLTTDMIDKGIKSGGAPSVR